MELFLHYASLPYLLEGIAVTLEVTALGLAGGLILGLALAAMQLSSLRPLSAFARAYAVIFRGTPLILQLVFAYDALPHIGLRLTAVAAAGLALSANEAPFIAEILRSAVRGVDRGQVSAGEALGMTPFVLMRRVIGPQAIRAMVPALGNESVSALKNSSLASVIAVQELTLRSTQLASSTFDFFSIFFASGAMYLLLTSGIGFIQITIERLLDLDRVKGVPAPAREPAPAPAPLRRRPSTDRQRRSASLADRPPCVEVRALRKRYADHVVLDGLNLTVRDGEVIALLGPSGSGKSTLLRCITLLEAWDEGTVHVAGRRLGFSEAGHRLGARAIARERAEVGVGMVFQQFNLFAHLSAHENVAGPLRWVHGLTPENAAARADELLARVGLAARAHALPRHLSGGQQQRVAIARALAPRPRVLLLDEPTSALDPELVGEVLDVVRRLAEEDGLTMIISTHQLRFAREVADRVVFLSGGAVAEEGPAEEILDRPRHPLTARFLSVMGEPGIGGWGVTEPAA
jgi:polar amino acid transport system permease protein